MNKTDEITSHKNNSRAHFKRIRQEISNEGRYLLDTAIISNVASLPEFCAAKTILCYYPVRNEPNILPLIKHSMKIGKAVAFPISHADTATLTFHKVSNLSALSIGCYGIPEPDNRAAAVENFENTICIVPALSYDSRGYRLGYGGGYYDRFLKGYTGISVLPIYSVLYSENLPIDKYDRPVDIIITEKGVAFSHEKRTSKR